MNHLLISDMTNGKEIVDCCLFVGVECGICEMRYQVKVIIKHEENEVV